jgi:hypothetical protein
MGYHFGSKYGIQVHLHFKYRCTYIFFIGAPLLFIGAPPFQGIGAPPFQGIGAPINVGAPIKIKGAPIKIVGAPILFFDPLHVKFLANNRTANKTKTLFPILERD